jgi:hypothetical protein
MPDAICSLCGDTPAGGGAANERGQGLSNYFVKIMTMTRWFGSAQESAQDPVWKTGKGGA